MGPNRLDTGTAQHGQSIGIRPVREQDSELRRRFVETAVVVQLADRLA
jgi:hypothetical protein